MRRGWLSTDIHAAGAHRLFLAFAAGFIVATGLLHAGGIGLGSLLGRASSREPVLVPLGGRAGDASGRGCARRIPLIPPAELARPRPTLGGRPRAIAR